MIIFWLNIRIIDDWVVADGSTPKMAVLVVVYARDGSAAV
jgi:hypothetical protein